MKKIILSAGAFLIAALTMSFMYQDDWVLFEGKGYKILFPKKPSDETQLVNTAVGKLQMNVHMYEVPENIPDDNHLYGAIETEYPDSVINSDKKEILDKFFRGTVDGTVNSIHGKLITETVIQFQGYPGREIRIDIGEGVAIVIMRTYLVKHTLYILQIITDTKKDHNKSMDKFMSSFTLTRSPGQ